MVEIIYDSNSIPELTVALPVYNSKKIAWLSIDSLCNQIDVNFNWELIIYEENHSESVFPNILNQYIDTLKNNNCSRIVFISGNEKVLLIDKWIEIANNASKSSIAFLLQAADCYSPKNRLKTSYNKIVKENYDWYDQTKGYFYSFISNKVILYDFKGLTNLNMCLKTEYIKTLPKSNINKGIDGYIYNHCLNTLKKSGKSLKRFYDNTLYQDSVDTHGYNNISKNREEYFTTKPNIFKPTKLNLNNLVIGEKIKNVDNVNYDLTIIISTYKNSQYLDECFNSIIRSIGNKNVEVLIGIDSCKESYDFVVDKYYPHNFKFYFFEENNGPYIVFNSLSNIAKSKNIMFFGSDDIMDKNMVEDIIIGLNNYDFVKPLYVNFNDGDVIDVKSKKFIGEGVFGVKKVIFDNMNGFEPWMCAADSDFMGRLYKSKRKLKITNKINFYRRIHGNGLTSRPDTGMRSLLRSNYVKISKNKSGHGNPEQLNTKDFIEVHTMKKFNLSNIDYSSITIRDKSKNPINGLFKRSDENQNIPQEINYEKVNEVINNRQVQKKQEAPRQTHKNSNINTAKILFMDKKMKNPGQNGFITGRRSFRI